jgi:hypothetical protein
MPSDDPRARALAALAGPRERFRSAVIGAVEEVRAFIAARRSAYDGKASAEARVELGAFAGGRIDAERFGSLFVGGSPLDAVSLARVEAALHELARIADAGDDLFHAEVRRGADLHLVAAHALASAGRAFGAAQAVELIRSGRWDVTRHAELLQPFPFRRWNRAERQIAPPLVVEVEGGAAHAGGLAELMDGEQKIVLLLGEPSPPAPLARLVTPGVFVMQTADAADLARAGRFAGPAVAALVPEGAARFVHDPAAGRTLRERLAVSYLPDTEPKSIEGYTAFQQREELALLRELSTMPAAPAPAAASGEAPAPAPASAEGPSGDADRLAEWLLRQSGLGAG